MNKNVKTALIIGGIIVAALIVLPMASGLISGWQYGGWGMMRPGMVGGFGWMWLMPVFWILFLGLIIWAIVASARRVSQTGGSNSSSSHHDSAPATADSALEVLKKRYARGEIDKEEYEKKKKDLA